MQKEYNELIQELYTAFNARDVEAALKLLDERVAWPNGWEGGYVFGHDGVRNYWVRQWREINPHVEIQGISNTSDGRVEVEVHSVVKDLNDKVLFNGLLRHCYSIESGKVTHMEIKKVV